jgi:hypothetical protein
LLTETHTRGPNGGCLLATCGGEETPRGVPPSPITLGGGVNSIGRASRDSLSPTRGDLKTPWAWGNNIHEGGGGHGLIVCVQMQMERSLMGVQLSLDSVGGMASRNPFNPKGNHNDHLSRRIGVDQGVGGSEAAETETKENG